MRSLDGLTHVTGRTCRAQIARAAASTPRCSVRPDGCCDGAVIRRSEMRRHVGTTLSVVAFVACIPLANWAILHLGADNGRGHPRTMPVGFGLVAPSGVLFAGALFTLRDLVHRRI